MSSEKVKLRDLIGYEAETYLSQEEVDLIRNTFKYNPQLIKVLRKVLIPTIHDLELPIEEIGKDAWMMGLDFQSMQEGEIKSIVLGRQEGIKFVIGGLISLKNIASQEEESEQDKKLRDEKNSTK